MALLLQKALFLRFPGALEGDLTRMRSQLVRKETLAAQARYLDMQHCLQLGSGELKSGGYDRDSILADAFEAVMGAIYLDSDLSTVKNTLLDLFKQQLEQISPLDLKDHKTRLQEHLQKHDLTLPIYQVIAQSGKPHALTFTVSCTVSFLPDPVTAVGSSRRSAEQNSAEKVLSILDTND